MAETAVGGSDAVLAVSGLCVSYKGATRERRVVADVSFRLVRGRVLGLAGETGCGKSTAALASTGYPLPGMASRRGAAVLDGVDLLRQPLSVLRRMWGKDIAFVSQQPAGTFSPVRKVWPQLDEALAAHEDLRSPQRAERIENVLASVGLAGLAGLRSRFPFELSGGQLQRLSLAVALLCRPRVVVFDEPTTSLDPTTQETVLELIRGLVTRERLAALYISHDLALLRALCDEIAIMYAGEIVEYGSASNVTAQPRHPYSSALLAAVPTTDSPSLAVALAGEPPDEVVAEACAFAPRCSQVQPACLEHGIELRRVGPVQVRCIRAEEITPPGPPTDAPEISVPAISRRAPEPVLAVADLVAGYGQAARPALGGIRIGVAADEVLALVGESGSGKSTLLRVLAGLHPPVSGQMTFCGENLPPRIEDRAPSARRNIQLVFQDAGAALNPRHTVGRSMTRAIARHQPELGRRERRDLAGELLEQVHLTTRLMDAYPAQLSGGQRQRVNLARALSADPQVLLCDEVTSALDVSVQAGILRLIAGMREERGLAVIFVTHDLAVVRSLADRVAVMWDGAVIEERDVDELFRDPSAPQTRKLLEAASYKSRLALTRGWSALAAAEET